MQQQTRLALKAAAWFFVGQTEDVGTQKNVPIKTPFRIGRNSDSDLCLSCHSVSGTHAEIFEKHGDLWLHDLNSTNGTFVNGKRIQSNNRLVENDTVQFGTAVFQITRAQEPDQVTRTAPGCEPGKEAFDSESDQFERLFNGGVVPFFQPILRIDEVEQTIVGYEVLGRSQLFGLRTPAQMFAVASRLEMQAELSRVLRKQGIDVADNHLPDHHLLFVNTHPAELECKGLVDSLFEIRDCHPRRPIMLEVHESILNDAKNCLELRSTLQNLDIKLAFHDFGAGQIRLAELSEVVPNVVKFDIRLIQGIDKATSKRQQFVASLVKMVTDLGITPLAECIEQTSEHQTLKQLGFQLGQGFLYGRPSSIADCAEHASRNDKIIPQTPQVKTFLDKPVTSAQAEISPHSTSGTKNADWLLAQPEHHYTIQVLSAISQQRAKEYIANQENPEEFAVFCKQGKTRMLYIVVYGVFADRAAAKAASAKLADSAISPWIRMFSSVHAEIRSGIET